MRKVLFLSISIASFSTSVCHDSYFPTLRDISTSLWQQKSTIAKHAQLGWNVLKNGYDWLMRKKVEIVPATIITALKTIDLNPDDFTFYLANNNTLARSNPSTKTLSLNISAFSQLDQRQQTAVGTVAALYCAHTPYPRIKIPKLGGIPLSMANGIYAVEKLASTQVVQLLEDQKQNKIKVLAKTLLTNEWFHLIAGMGLELGFLHYMECSPEIKKHAILSRLAKKGIPLACKTAATQLQKLNIPELPKKVTTEVLNNGLLHWSLTQAVQYKVDEQLTYDMDQYAVQTLGTETTQTALMAMQNQYESYKPAGFFDSLSYRLETAQSYIKWNPSMAFDQRIDLIKQS